MKILIHTIFENIKGKKKKFERNNNLVYELFKMDKNISIIDTKIKQLYPKIDKLINISSIVKGYVQSGKTHFELCMIWRSIYISGRLAILILANNINSFLQINERDIPEFNQWISLILGIKDSFLYFLTIGIKNKFIISLSNPSQLNNIKNNLLTINMQYDIIVDEADTSIKDIEIFQTSTKTGFIFDSLVNKSMTYCQVTATPFANLNKKNNYAISYQLPKPINYRGIEEIKWRKCNDNLRNKNKLNDLLEVVRESIQICKKCPSGYKSILVNASQAKKVQKNQAKEIKKTFPHIKVYVINTDVNNEIKEININGDYINLKIYSIQELYKFFEIYKWDNIIVSCFKANRANSYRPVKSIGSGGLSGMIYIPSKTSHCSQLIQAMRIFGIYDSSYPLIYLWTTSNAYFRIKKETINIDKLTQATSNELCYTRNKIEGVQIYNVGRHDRKEIDDTILEKQYDLWKIEYNTLDEARKNIPFLYNKIKNMNYKPRNIVIDGDINDNWVKNNIRKNLRNNYSEIINLRIRIANNFQYYERLFDLYFRYTHNAMANIIVGHPDIINNSKPFVEWRPEYCNTCTKLENFDKYCLYWFYTTNGKIRVWMNLFKVKVGSLTHQ